MTIYLGGVLGGCVGGWLAIQSTFLAGAAERVGFRQGLWRARAARGLKCRSSGARSPWITSAPFDNWWHNAYGLDVKIISPPHTLLGMGMLGIVFGAWLLVLARQNRLQDGAGSASSSFMSAGLFHRFGRRKGICDGIRLSQPRFQHGALFY